jgi:PAS domain S-box
MERYEMVAKATNDAIYEWDVVKDVTYWGEGLFTLFGHPRCEDAMSPSTWLDNLHPDEKDSILARAMSLFQVQQKSLTREMRFRCADGSYKIVFDKQNIYYDKNGKPVRVVGAMQDITDRKKSEAAVKDLNLELEKKAEKLKRSNEELERFAYVASHDLQEPLRMVGSFLQLLQKKYRDKLDATAHQYIDFAVDGSVRMKKLINDLLEYARVGTDREAFFKVDMGAVVNDVLRDFKRASENGVFRVGFMPWVKGQKTQLTQVMNNLIGNALKYNKSETPEVEIGCTESDTEWQFYIKDNGIGIEEKYLEKVFVIFQRLHNRSEFPGTGIGLSICRKIVERHGGRIWIESAPDHGSTVFFTIKKLNGRD